LGLIAHHWQCTICHPELPFMGGEEPAPSLSRGSQIDVIEILHYAQNAPFRMTKRNR
jgi:hypothetical protein